MYGLIQAFDPRDFWVQFPAMGLIAKLKACFAGKVQPEHLRRGESGEHAAKKFLRRSGLKFLAANFRSTRGEIDLVFRDQDCLVFVSFQLKNIVCITNNLLILQDSTIVASDWGYNDGFQKFNLIHKPVLP